MESEKATTDLSGTPGAARVAAEGAGLPEFLRFLEGERRRSQRAAIAAAIFGVAIGALATAAWWTRAGLSDRGTAASEEIAQRLHGLESASGTLAAQVRALASRPKAGEAGADSAAPARAEHGDASIAGKPSTDPAGEDGAARHSGEDALARALAHAQQIPLAPLENVGSKAPAEAAAPDPKSTLSTESATDAKSETKGDADAEAKAKAAATETTIAAFNSLLVDCGLDQWRLMSAEVASEDHSLHKVVMAHRAPNGTANGSLTAERLALERDAGTGVAAFVVTGARRTEAGVEEAFPNGTTRIEVPGLLPLELVPPILGELFGTSQNGAIGTTARVDMNDPNQVARAINRVLGLEKGVSLRIRSFARFNDDKLEKAIIDLTFDERGEPQQTVFADKAWFELDAKRDYAELCCDGGDMVVAGARRPLFRGHLRWPIHSVTPPQWRGMPSLRLVTGS